MSTERPILFTGEMVLATLDDRKSQTRRTRGLDEINQAPGEWSISDQDLEFARHTGEYIFRRGLYVPGYRVRCPYGQPGDRLWVRERMRRIGAIIGEDDGRPRFIDVRYEADGEFGMRIPFPERLKGVPKHGQCLAYGGYREASRILLEVTDVRVERVQEISESDAMAEGWSKDSEIHTDFGPHRVLQTMPPSCRWFRSLWDSINGKKPGRSWADNPWVWVVSFRRVER